MFAIEASEFVQGQNDLITAVAGVEKARSRLLLAQTPEKRQRELQAIRGGALKDLEQAQSDLVGAQGDLRSADIALAAVRNRLRILGRSEEEIAQHEKQRPHRRRGHRIGADRRHDHAAQGWLGQYINVGANDPVFIVGNLSTVWLIANVRKWTRPR